MEVVKLQSLIGVEGSVVSRGKGSSLLSRLRWSLCQSADDETKRTDRGENSQLHTDKLANNCEIGNCIKALRGLSWVDLLAMQAEKEGISPFSHIRPASVYIE